MALTRPRLSQLNTNASVFTDSISVLNQGATAASSDVGFLFNRANGLVSNVALYWSETAQSIVTAYTSDAGEAASNIAATGYANLTVGNVLLVNGGIIGVVGNLQLGNLIANTGIYAPAYYYANGAPFVSSTYGNVEVGAYIPTDSTIITLGSRIDGANAAIVTANTALKNYADAQITTANTALKNYTDSQITAVGLAWTSNAAAQSAELTALGGRVDAANAAAQSYTNSAITNLINAAPGALDTLGEIAANLADGSSAVAGIVNSISNTNANVTAANAAIATLQTQVYSNSNVAAYLPTYTGQVGATNANHVGGGTYLTSLNADNFTTGTIPAARVVGSYPNITGIGILTEIDVTGTASIGGNLDIAGNLNLASGNITISNSGSFIGNAVTGYGALYAGIPSGYASLPSTPFQVATNDNTYSQLNMQNINGGSYASSDYVVTADNGTDSTYYGDFGIASSNFEWPELGLTAVGPNDVYLMGVGYSANGPYTGNVANVVISSSNGLIKLASGGANIANVVATVHGTGMTVESTTSSTSTSTGALTVAGGVGITGNVYASAVYDSGNRVVSTSSGSGNLSIIGAAITLPATGPGVTTVGSATTIPVITTDAYGRVTALTTESIGSVSTTINFAGTSGTGSVEGGGTLTFAGSNGFTATASGSTITLSTPQDLQTTASPTFAGGSFTGNVSRNAKPLITNYTGNTAPTSPIQGDEWFRANTGVMYKYIYDNVSSTYNWVNYSSALFNANTGAVANTLALRDSGGNLTATNFLGTASSAKYADLAEIYTSDKNYEPGTVVVFGGTAEITATKITHDTRVAGVISTNPAYLMNSEAAGLPVAFTGRVPCKVRGPVAKGDVLVTSAWPEYAERMADTLYQPGCILGKSLNEVAENVFATIEVVVGRF